VTEVRLSDGATVILRPIRPSDRDLLLDGFERLSPQSRYRRFLAPMDDLSEPMLRYLTEVDHHDHEAIGAIDPASGHGIGIARFIRQADQPDAAEAAVTVADDWQRRGLGTLLLGALADRARSEGIRVFTAVVLAANAEMLEVLEHVGRLRIVDRQAGTVEIEVDVPSDRAELRRLLRAAQAGNGPARWTSPGSWRPSTPDSHSATASTPPRSTPE
jgi:GNAT superfamily N-acetyltransferase